MLRYRLNNDIGVPASGEARRYIAACDYRENNEYWLIAERVVAFSDHRAIAPVILDIGSGPGTLCECIRLLMPRARVIGIDASKTMFEHARSKYHDCQFINGMAEDIPLPSEFVDIVVSSNTLHHLHDPLVVFSEMLRVMKPAGVGYVIDLRRDAPQVEVAKKCERMNQKVLRDFKRSLRSALTSNEITRWLEDAGAANVGAIDVEDLPGLHYRYNDPYSHECDSQLYYGVIFNKKNIA